MTTSDPTEDILIYVRSRFANLDRQAAEIKENALRMAVAVATYCREPLYTRVLDRVQAGYIDVPADQINVVVRRITAEEAALADSK